MKIKKHQFVCQKTNHTQFPKEPDSISVLIDVPSSETPALAKAKRGMIPKGNIG